MNTADDMGRTPLYHVVYRGDIAMVRNLLGNGSTGITRKSRAGHSPMSIAKFHQIQGLSTADMTMQWIWDLLLDPYKAMVDSLLEGAQPVAAPEKEHIIPIEIRRMQHVQLPALQICRANI